MGASSVESTFVLSSPLLLLPNCTVLTLHTTPHLALAGDGLVEQQAAAILLLQAGVVGPRRASSSSAGAPEGLEAVGRERRGRRGRVGLVAGGRPAPVSPRGAVAGRREGTHRAVVFPGAVQTLCGGGDPPRTERTKENIKERQQKPS